MRTRIYFMVFMLMLSACNKKKDKGVIISVLEDTTEIDFIVRPSCQMIISKFGLKNDPWRSARFRYGTINSLMHNGREELSIKTESELLGNEFERRKIISDFNQDIEAILETPRDSMIYEQSSIWLPLLEEIESFKEGSQRKIIYLFSDLRENTSWFSTYRNSDMETFRKNPDIILELFMEKSLDIKPPNGINVVVVYQPRNVADDTMFRQMRELYTALFLRLDIPITFTANLNNEPL